MNVRVVSDDLRVSLSPESSFLLPHIRALPFRRFDSQTLEWVIPLVMENWDLAASRGLTLFDGIERPSTRGSEVVAGPRGMLLLRVAPTRENIDRCRSIPDARSWNQSLNGWTVKPTRQNVEFINESWPDIHWSAEAQDLAQSTEAPAVQSKSQLLGLMEAASRDFKFHTTPYQHQLEAFALSRDAKVFALFMEQGTGKTKVTIDTAGYLYVHGKIDRILVICPRSVKSTWLEEVATHLPSYINRRVLVWASGKTKQADLDELEGKRNDQALRFLIMNIDAVNTTNGIRAAEEFLARGRGLAAVDESSKIKSHTAKRTKAIWKLGKKAEYRRILTGTPVTQSPLDVYSQFAYLDPNILGFSSYYPFRNHFALLGGFQNRQVLKYVNLHELQDLVTPYSFRVTRDECLDLPEKIFQKRTVDLSDEQRRLYDEMTNSMTATLEENRQVTTALVLTQLLRLQQIVGGFLPHVLTPEEAEKDPTRITAGEYRPIAGQNPKLDALLETVEEGQGKFVIWAHFRAEIDLISRSLRQLYGDDSVREFHGGIPDVMRTEARQSFQDKASPVRFFVAQTETGGIGITLTAAHNVVYYSNSFSLESRLQSEDRTHRIGQTEHVTYTDIVAAKTIDEKLARVLRRKLGLANVITGDNWKEWL